MGNHNAMSGQFGFGNVQFVPGMGFVQANGGTLAGSPLGNEADVMMISGVGDGDVQQSFSSSAQRPLPGWADLKKALSNSYRFFGVELPMWLWLLIAAGAVGAGVFWFKKGSFKKLLSA